MNIDVFPKNNCPTTNIELVMCPFLIFEMGYGQARIVQLSIIFTAIVNLYRVCTQPQTRGGGIQNFGKGGGVCVSTNTQAICTHACDVFIPSL